jgi:hypothetical protein
MRGAVTIEVVDRSGKVVHHEHRRNRIVLSGRNLVAHMFAGATSPPSGPPPTSVTHVGVGTDATAPADGQTALRAERAGRSPLAAAVYQDVMDGQVMRRKVSLTAVFDFGQANGAPNDPPLREAGLFTAAAGGVMYNRVVLDPVTKTNAFKLTVLWDIVF